ncbi:MAG: peptide chain release factor N(5)-glutamine methyltransferase [Prevotella sp.]|nr:peptide chain release factor N(5)-glutamine methyltransferase [Prevotella sp.]
MTYLKENLDGIYSGSEIALLHRLIAEHVTGLSAAMLSVNKSKKLNSLQQQKFKEIVGRLKKFEPVQYILGETEFFGLPFQVDKNVLIPRPETEELVELVLNENRTERLSVLDIGTGSGAIAVALKKLRPSFTVKAWDISPEALAVARRNAQRHQTDLCFEQVDVLGEYPREQQFDVIVSNPPYVTESEKANMEQNVLAYEPHIALFVPDEQALLFYERIAEIASHILNPAGKLYFEINSAKGQEVFNLLKDKSFKNVEIFSDISGNRRIARAERW